ncbi:FixH family protein [soil metagenome]
MTRPFTGRHMLAIIIAFFGVVIAVNFVMARFAVVTFGGTVVDNSYVASQSFNHWLDQARGERRMAWHVQSQRLGSHLTLTLSDMQGTVDGAKIAAVAEHPLGRMPDLPMHFRQVGRGYYRSIEQLPPGRWRLKLDIKNHFGGTHLIEDVGA